MATSVPEDYVAPAAFATLALQHTNVKLTWDKDDDARKRTLAKRVTKDELRDDDFKARIDRLLFIRAASSTLQLQTASTGCFMGSLCVQAFCLHHPNAYATTCVFVRHCRHTWHLRARIASLTRRHRPSIGRCWLAMALAAAGKARAGVQLPHTTRIYLR